MTALPALGSVEGDCPKCYRPRVDAEGRWDERADRMKRTCQCGYYWYEAPRTAGQAEGEDGCETGPEDRGYDAREAMHSILCRAAQEFIDARKYELANWSDATLGTPIPGGVGYPDPERVKRIMDTLRTVTDEACARIGRILRAT